MQLIKNIFFAVMGLLGIKFISENVFLSIVLAGLGVFAWYKWNQSKLIKDKAIHAKLAEHYRRHTLPHAETLGKLRAELITTDKYGDIDTSAWENEIANFASTKIPHITSLDMITSKPSRMITEQEVVAIIDQIAKNAATSPKSELNHLNAG